MATRAHVCVALLLTTTTGFLTAGCIFGGGGGDKKRAAAAAAAAPQAATVAPVPQAAAAPQPDPVKARTSKHADEAIARALTPKESAVQWPDPAALSLGDSGPAAARTPAPDPAPVARREVRQPGVPAAPAELPQDGVEAAEPSPDAVANEPLEVTGASPRHAAEPAAVAIPDDGMELAVDAVQPAAARNPASTAASDSVASRVAQRLRENPGDVATHLDHQLLRFLMDEQAPDLAALSTLPAEDRELLTALVDGLTNFRTGLRTDQNMLHSRKVRPLLDMAARLRSQAELWIPTIALCTRVKRYGVYEPINPQFVAGTSHEVLVYCEVANFASQQNEQGVWEVKLSQEAILYKDDGQRVWANRKETTVDEARNRRQDFCVAQRVVLPSNLPIDRYILKVTVTDEQVKRLAEATIPIELVAQLDPQQPAAPQPQRQQPKGENLGPIARPSDAATDDSRTAGFSSGRAETADGK